MPRNSYELRRRQELVQQSSKLGTTSATPRQRFHAQILH